MFQKYIYFLQDASGDTYEVVLHVEEAAVQVVHPSLTVTITLTSPVMREQAPAGISCIFIFLRFIMTDRPPFQHSLSERLTSLGIMGEPRVPPLNPSETIVLSEHYRL